MKRITFILVLLIMLGWPYLYSQTNVTFLNTGQMYVAGSTPLTRVSLYIPDAMRHFTVLGRTVNVIQNGITELGGNFYQDANTNVFGVDASSKTTSTGKFRFVKEHPGINRLITTQSVNINTFDRGANYIAFPQVEISTNDSIEVPGKMGIDATNIHVVSSKTGKLILRSDIIGVNTFDAALRITQSGASASLVDAGAVVVERNMIIYRPNDGSTQMFGFATPFKNTQLSGYFAGNWVRRPQNTGTYNHTTYIYGNKDVAPADGIIDNDQYIYLAAEKMVPAQAYLVKPRPKEYAYSNLKTTSGLWYTGEPNPSMYDKGKYYFNGKVYTVGAYAEQLFADDALFASTINTPNLSSTVNWVIGNSYTCPISTTLLAQAMESSSLEFSPYIYVFPAGSTTFQACDISGTSGSIVVSTVDEIPAMSVFMVRVARNKAQNGSLVIGKDLLRHASVAHNNPQKAKASNQAVNSVQNQVSFRVSPVGNDNIYDVTAIGLRTDALKGSDVYDMAKAYVNDENIFQLYTLSDTQAKLSANGFPVDGDSIVMAFTPSKYAGDFNLSSKFAESLTTDGVWIYDKQTHATVDMKAAGNYQFSTTPTDVPERFLITFKRPVSTEKKELFYNLKVYYHNQKVRAKELTELDLGSSIALYDMQGRQLFATTVNNYPEMQIDLKGLSPGIYVIQLKGERTAIAKFVVN